MERLFLTGDVDRNSELDGDECIPMRGLLKSTLQKKGDLLRQKYDVNKDGKLTEDEALLLAKNEFGVLKDEGSKEFTLSDQVIYSILLINSLSLCKLDRMILLLLSLAATVFASPLPPAEAGDTWLQVCCQDNDLNSNGGINFREFTVFALNLMNLDRAEMERLFLTGDVDRNSELDGDECIPMRGLLKSTLQKKGDLLRQKYDVNKDGKLTEDEALQLAKNEFGVLKDEGSKEFTLSDQAFDTNHDGKVSYEEIKHEILRSTDGFTLKQIFKGVDFDKDYHLTVHEYLTLLNELELKKKGNNLESLPITLHMGSPPISISRQNSEESIMDSTKEGTSKATESTSSENLSSSTVSTSVVVQIRSKRNTAQEMVRVAPSRSMHEFQFDEESQVVEKAEGTTGLRQRVRGSATVKFAQNGSRRTKRGGNTKEDTALPLISPTKQLKKEEMAKLSEKTKNNLSGGGRAPTIDESVTVPYDDKDFQ
ncbi:EF hand [Necator americanus]|uniref:EF hand n=1 Tax=Necator americanus TaxID=51031 RepID=W2SSH1_NECAM|nr:EF hand [Necator americanus]ETN72458.1 EF hand [Necator americanus]